MIWSVPSPLGMSAGSDDPGRAASRVSVISSIGYCAFLAGPPLSGFLGERVTVLGALMMSAALLLAIAVVVAAAPRRCGRPSARWGRTRQAPDPLCVSGDLAGSAGTPSRRKWGAVVTSTPTRCLRS